MKNKARRVMTGILALILVFSVFMIIRQGLDKSQGKSDYDRALQVAVSGRDVTEPVADTKIDYPVMQGEDNDYYLNHTWEKKSNYVGSIFMECQNNPNMGDYNTLIYGHNMKDGSMFAALRRYGEQKFYEEHPYVYLVTDSGILRYEIFSSYKADVDSETYGLSFQQSQTRESFLTAGQERSVIKTEIEPGIRDRILTLSTCSASGYSTRWVVHARLKLVQTEM